MATVNPLFNNNLIFMYNHLLKKIGLTVVIFASSTIFTSCNGDFSCDIEFFEKKMLLSTG